MAGVPMAAKRQEARRDLQEDRSESWPEMPFKKLKHPVLGEVQLEYEATVYREPQKFLVLGAGGSPPGVIQPILKLMEMCWELRRRQDGLMKERDDAILQAAQLQEELGREQKRREELERRYGKGRKGGTNSEPLA